MADESYTESDLLDWQETVTGMGPDATHSDSGDYSDAYEAVANLCSAWGTYFHMPEPIAKIVEHALQVGYQQALGHVRGGDISGLGEVDE